MRLWRDLQDPFDETGTPPRNLLEMRSPKGYSVAVRRLDGTVRVMKDPLLGMGDKWKVFKTPILRGVGVLGQALVLGIKALLFSAEEALAEESATKEGKTAEVKTTV